MHLPERWVADDAGGKQWQCASDGRRQRQEWDGTCDGTLINGGTLTGINMAANRSAGKWTARVECETAAAL